jgi:hypothetical protein
MCPDPQLLSVYMDGELPSPWKEKMEAHLSECSVCKGNYDSFKRLQEYFKKDTHQRRTIVERAVMNEQTLPDYEFMEKSREKVWRKLEARQRFSARTGLWQRSLSIPLPAAAAAAVVIAILAMFFINNSSNTRQYPEPSRSNFILASEEEMNIMPAAVDMNGVLQYLGGDSADTLIFKLPESKNFLRTGEPAMVRAADYTRRQP